MGRPRPKHQARSINQDRLSVLRDSGCDSELLLARLAYQEHEGTRKDLAKLGDVSRVFPTILPTQASLRWSTKEPNLGGFTREFWRLHYNVVLPDDGWWWLGWDWQGIEARMFLGYTGDQEDLDLLEMGPELHTFTCAKYLMEWAPRALPGCQTSDLHLPHDWLGGKDERRVRAKNFRYGVGQYGTSAKAVLGIPGIEKLGLDRVTLQQRAERFLAARPKAVAWKQTIWQQCIEQRSARTFMGHRRHLYGDEDTRKKDGLNHMIQGSVANMMNWCLIEIDQQVYPESHMILNKHDGALVAFPDRLNQEQVVPAVRSIVEREWEIGPGIKMRFPAEWEVLTSDGSRRELQ